MSFPNIVDHGKHVLLPFFFHTESQDFNTEHSGDSVYGVLSRPSAYFPECFWQKYSGPWMGEEHSPGTFAKQSICFSAYKDDI